MYYYRHSKISLILFHFCFTNNFMFSFTRSINLLFVLPLGLPPGKAILYIFYLSPEQLQTFLFWSSNIAGLSTTPLFLFSFSRITPDTLLQQTPFSTLFICLDPKYLFHFNRSHLNTYSVLLEPTFISLLSISTFSFTCSLLSPEITMSSANIAVHGHSCLTSSVSLSITLNMFCSPEHTEYSPFPFVSHQIFSHSFRLCPWWRSLLSWSLVVIEWIHMFALA